MIRAMLATSLLVFSFAPADAAKVRWFGYYIIKGKAGTCNDYNPVGNRGTLHFEPRLGGTDNTDHSAFVLYNRHFAAGFRLADPGKFGRAWKNVETIYTGSNFGSDDTATPQVRFLQQAPKKIKKTTEFINVVAKIKNYDFMPGCVVTVHMAMLQRL